MARARRIRYPSQESRSPSHVRIWEASLSRRAPRADGTRRDAERSARSTPESPPRSIGRRRASHWPRISHGDETPLPVGRLTPSDALHTPLREPLGLWSEDFSAPAAILWPTGGFCEPSQLLIRRLRARRRRKLDDHHNDQAGLATRAASRTTRHWR